MAFLSRWIVFSRNYPSPEGVDIVLGKSMPRSGHHLLARLLRAYFQQEFHYCEYYKPEHCCGTIPCRKPRPVDHSNRFFMQKSHDFRLKDAVLDQYKHIIQYRHPLPRAQSNFELAVQNGMARDNQKSFKRFFRRDMRYFIRFYRKWIASPPQHTLLLSYEQLTANSLTSLIRAIRFISDAEANEKRASNIIARQANTNAQTGKAHQARSIETHRYYDPVLYRRWEDEVFRACPNLQLDRYF